MNHDSNKSPSIGMISTATRTTATVSPLNPLTNGSAVSQAANSGFAAALRKLAKQAEDPRASALSREPSPVSSPSTRHNSPVTTPKRPAVGALLGQSRGHSVPGAPPVVTIAPTKTSNSLWRSDTRQTEASVRERLENTLHSQDKRTPPLSSPRTLAHPFGLQPSSVMQDPRLQSLSLPGQMHPGVPPGAVAEEYLRALRPFTTSDDLRLTSVPMGLDPAAAHAAAAAAYYHPAYLPHPLSLQRMEESLCLSALRAPFYSMPGGGAFPSLHPSALHLHLPGSRYPAELNHTALAERLQMESELRQREREHEREREKERERGAKGAEREREREEEADRQKERHRDRQQQMVRGAESHYLAELQARRAPPEDRPRPGERLTPNRPDKVKESEHLGFPAPKPLSRQSSLQSSRGTVPHPVPNLVPSHMGKHHSTLAAAMMTQRMSEDVWLTRHRGQDRELDLRSPGKGAEPWRENHRSNSVRVNSHSKDTPPSLGAPPPLISPKVPPNPSVPATTLWNPASFVDSPPARRLAPSTPPCRPPPGLTRTDRPALGWGERTEDSRRRAESLERYHSARGANLHDAASWGKAELDRTMQSLYQRQHMGNLQQRASAPLCTPLSSADVGVRERRSSLSPASERHSHVPDSLLVYDEVLQQHRRLLSKLDLEEKRRREAREGGYYYDMNESYDESDEEEVKAHLRRVTEQPPLRLDTCSEKVEFLSMCGLTTHANRNELLAQKRRKRRRMLRERSLSPPATRVKKKTCPTLTTPYTAEQMDRTPELGQKKDFLSMFSLSHVSPAERREKQKTEELLKAIKKKTVTLDTLRYNPNPPCSTPSPPPLNGDSKSLSLPNGHPFPDSPSPSPPFLHKPKNALYNDALKSSLDPPVARIPTPQAPHHEKTEFMEPNRKLHGSMQNGIVVSPLKKTPHSGQNGRSRPWEKFTPEVFAQHFHQAVLQSTHIKDGLLNSDHPLPHKASPLKDIPHHRSQHINGHQLPLHGPSRDTPSAHESLSDEEGLSGQDEEEEEEEEEAAPRKWQGIEFIFEAYHQYAEEHSIERQVLHSQCKKLEAQNHHLTRTAEQLSQTMGELMSQRQRVREENERLQAQLEHFRRCLTLPNLQWSRGQVNGHTPR